MKNNNKNNNQVSKKAIALFMLLAIAVGLIFGRGISMRMIDYRVSLIDIFKPKPMDEIIKEVRARYKETDDTFKAINDTEKEQEVAKKEIEEPKEEEPEVDLGAMAEERINNANADFERRILEKVLEEQEKLEATLKELEKPKDDMTVTTKDPAKGLDKTKDEKEIVAKIEKEAKNKQEDNKNIAPKKPTKPKEKKSEDGITYINENTRDNNGTIEVLVPGFGWQIYSPGGTSTPAEPYQGEDWYEQVGTMN